MPWQRCMTMHPQYPMLSPHGTPRTWEVSLQYRLSQIGGECLHYRTGELVHRKSCEQWREVAAGAVAPPSSPAECWAWRLLLQRWKQAHATHRFQRAVQATLPPADPQRPAWLGRTALSASRAPHLTRRPGPGFAPPAGCSCDLAARSRPAPFQSGTRRCSRPARAAGSTAQGNKGGKVSERRWAACCRRRHRRRHWLSPVPTWAWQKVKKLHPGSASRQCSAQASLEGTPCSSAMMLPRRCQPGSSTMGKLLGGMKTSVGLTGPGAAVAGGVAGRGSAPAPSAAVHAARSIITLSIHCSERRAPGGRNFAICRSICEEQRGSRLREAGMVQDGRGEVKQSKISARPAGQQGVMWCKR